MRPIDADSHKDSIRKEKRWIVKRDGYTNEGFSYDQVMFAIDKAPTIDAKPVVHGHWIDDGLSQMCSVCRMDFARYDDNDSRLDFNFCPECGADMRGED